MWYGKNDGKWDDDSEIAPKQLTAAQVVEELKRQENIQRLKDLLEELFNDKRY
jgi:hypothetical protein